MNPTIELLTAALAIGLVLAAPVVVFGVRCVSKARVLKLPADPISKWLTELPEVRSEDVFTEAGEDTVEVPA